VTRNDADDDADDDNNNNNNNNDNNIRTKQMEAPSLLVSENVQT
jgi:hypothetical protein